MCKLQNYLSVIGDLSAKRIIKQVHARQLAVSPTAKNELEIQLNKPNAGIKAHVRSCAKCAAAIEKAANPPNPAIPQYASGLRIA